MTRFRANANSTSRSSIDRNAANDVNFDDDDEVDDNCLAVVDVDVDDDDCLVVDVDVDLSRFSSHNIRIR